jgi:hypothetical protein
MPNDEGKASMAFSQIKYHENNKTIYTIHIHNRSIIHKIPKIDEINIFLTF